MKDVTCLPQKASSTAIESFLVKSCENVSGINTDHSHSKKALVWKAGGDQKGMFLYSKWVT